jgi:hypothetical protein
MLVTIFKISSRYYPSKIGKFRGNSIKFKKKIGISMVWHAIFHFIEKCSIPLSTPSHIFHKITKNTPTKLPTHARKLVYNQIKEAIYIPYCQRLFVESHLSFCYTPHQKLAEQFASHCCHLSLRVPYAWIFSQRQYIYSKKKNQYYHFIDLWTHFIFCFLKYVTQNAKQINKENTFT